MRHRLPALTLFLLGCSGAPEGPAPLPLVAPPTVVLPDQPAATEPLTARLALARGASDPGEVAWSWTVDGQATPWNSDTVPPAELRIGQLWTATATVEGLDEPVSAQATISRVGGNILVILLDDVGVDRLGRYGVHDVVPPTPTIDALADEGVLFRNLWVQPTCSPTRAALLTGRYPRRTGVGRWIMPPNQTRGMDFDEVLIPEMLAQAPVQYEDALVGKWHLTGFDDNPDPGSDPLAAGIGWFAGTLGNPDNSAQPSASPRNYYWWEKATNGELEFSSDYLTTVTADDALERAGAMAEPWLLWVAFNAPHTPLHDPPAYLHHYDLAPGVGDDYDRYDAMLEAVDTEMGRFLDGIDPDVMARTTVFLISDNGTPDHAIRPPLDPDRSKGTLYEGGVNVPMIVTGPMVDRPGSETLAMVESVDLFSTIAELAGVNLQTVIDPRTDQPVVTDGQSFLQHVIDPDLPSTRDRSYSSKHFPNGPPPHEWEHDALRDEQYKIAYHSSGQWWFFEYQGLFDEGQELLAQGPLTPEQQEAYDRLSVELIERMESLDFGP